MARLFISYKREEQDYAFALRQWLIDQQGWSDDDIFVDRAKLRGGDEWADTIFTQAEQSVMCGGRTALEGGCGAPGSCVKVLSTLNL